MQLGSIVTIFAVVFAAMTQSIAAPAKKVYTVKRVYHAVITKSPYMVERTSTMVWTAEATPTDSA
ncbi:hypothetical protein AMATHDRAFT_6368 [Amanita thiersii Skay4041]|uniref:Uncharacterized protein n=1 Tax=Amanita thiersii Skay4041 TaxID=703135 RepID=A0A2A9N9Z6_9AGAR|nr:hypothetical protein AMATHDRAFT_6368 [Amanita thiersii Skay4041]